MVGDGWLRSSGTLEICEASGALRRRRSPLEGAEMAPLALAKTVNIIAEKHLVILFT
jgi:hypothetical protein